MRYTITVPCKGKGREIGNGIINYVIHCVCMQPAILPSEQNVPCTIQAVGHVKDAHTSTTQVIGKCKSITRGLHIGQQSMNHSK